MSDKYVRVTINVEWGEWQAQLGKIQSSQQHGEVRAMPATIEGVRDLVAGVGVMLSKEVAESLERRERTVKDVMQPKNYGQKP